MEAQATAVVQDQVVMVMLARRRFALCHAKTARHAQVHEQGSPIKAGENVFATSFQGLNRLTLQDCGQIGLYGPAQMPVPYDQFPDRLVEKMRLNAPQRGFDFGQFRHGSGLRYDANAYLEGEPQAEISNSGHARWQGACAPGTSILGMR
jgi:hypothetical protein